MIGGSSPGSRIRSLNAPWLLQCGCFGQTYPWAPSPKAAKIQTLNPKPSSLNPKPEGFWGLGIWGRFGLREGVWGSAAEVRYLSAVLRLTQIPGVLLFPRDLQRAARQHLARLPKLVMFPCHSESVQGLGFRV